MNGGCRCQRRGSPIVRPMDRAVIVSLVLAAVLSAQEPGQTVAHRVIDEMGRPLAGITIAPTQEGAPIVESGADGTFTTPRGSGFVLRGRGRATAQVTGDVGGGDIVMVPGTLLVGRIVDDAGTPVAGATVTTKDLLAVRMHWLPRPRSAPVLRATATSKGDGTFVVEGAPSALVAIDVRHADLLPESVEAITPGEPVEVVMERPRLVRGTVVGVDGKPVAGAAVQVMSRTRSHSVRTDDEGNFVVRAPRDIDAEVVASANLGASWARGSVAVEPGAAEPLRIRLAPTGAGAARSIARTRLCVRDADGTVVPQVRAVFVEPHGDPSHFERTLAGADPLAAGADGIVRIVGTGTLVELAAAGYGRVRLPVDTDARVPIDVELPPPARIFGRTLQPDGTTPIPGVALAVFRKEDWDRESFQRRLANFGSILPPTPPNAARSGADGSFEIGGLGPGEWVVYPMPRDRPRIEPVPVVLGRGETKRGVAVAIPPGATFTLKFVGGDLPADLRVRFPAMLGPGCSSSSWDSDCSGAAEPDADGVVVFRHLPRARHRLELLVPQPPRLGGPRKVVLREVPITAQDAGLEIDLERDRLRSVSGRVKVVGPPLPAGRTIVVASPRQEGVNMFWGFVRLDGAMAWVEADGSFDLRLEPDTFDLLVLDAATLAVLTKPFELVVSPAGQLPSEVELTAEVTRVRLTVEGSDALRRATNRISVDLGAFWPGGVGRIVPNPADPILCGVGTALTRGRDRYELWLPRTELVLAAYAARASSGTEPVGRVAFDTTGRDTLDVTLPLGR